ncbi:MAG: hypothetical protein HZB57_06655 [Gammaproteobacteria bacterium]|nr:hypothetical protein [Gammaproteobacteria bacterium]
MSFTLPPRLRARLAAACLALAAPVAVFASGSDASGAAETGSAAAYNLGKAVYATKYACASCPLADKKVDAGIARDILDGKPEVTLDANEADAIKTYLKRRFKL